MANTLYIPLYPEEQSAAPTKVCVTGATGLVAGPIIERLLAAGHTVHGTVRDPSKEALLAPLKALPGAESQLHIFKADLLEEGSFVEAISGCKFVIHTASPFFTPDDPADNWPKLLDPALKGTENVLNAVNGCDSVERVVLTSSVAAIRGGPKDGITTEDDWNEVASDSTQVYCYSKVLAERKAWEMANAQNRWKLVVINPTYVFGPPIGNRLDGTSMDIVTAILSGKQNDTPDRTYTIVDVRDVAAAHCLAMVHPNAHGRNICCENTYTVSQICSFIAEKYPSLHVPKSDTTTPLALDNSKLQRELGFKFHSTKQCMQDMAAKLIAIGKVTLA